MLLHAQEELALARVGYARAAELEPASARWLYLLGRVERQLGDTRAAERTLGMLADDPLALVELAELQFDDGRLDEAEQTYERAPDSPAVRYGVGQILLARGAIAEATRELTLALDQAPDYASAWYALALAYRRSDQPDLAKHAFEAYERARPRAWTPPNPLIDEVRALYSGPAGHLARGAEAARRGDFEIARDEFEAAVDADPSSATAHSNLVALFTQMGRLDDAKGHYQAALAINPNWADAHIAWGSALSSSGKIKAAIKAFETARDINPYRAEARVQLGLLYQDRGLDDAAVAEYQAAVEHNPLHSQANQLLGENLIRAGRLEDGLERISRTLPNDESAPGVFEALANQHESSGNLKAARWYLTRGIELARKYGRSDIVARLEQRLK